jgi:hypothetical protein
VNVFFARAAGALDARAIGVATGVDRERGELVVLDVAGVEPEADVGVLGKFLLRSGDLKGVLKGERKGF